MNSMDLFLLYVLMIMGVFALYPISMDGFKQLVKDIIYSVVFIVAKIIKLIMKMKR